MPSVTRKAFFVNNYQQPAPAKRASARLTGADVPSRLPLANLARTSGFLTKHGKTQPREPLNN